MTMSNSSANLPMPPHVGAMSDEEKRLRKAWLKKRFDSFDYHEELVRVHDQWRAVLRKALERAKNDDRQDPDYGTMAAYAENFRNTYWPIIESEPRPGDYKRDQWHQYRGVGLFRSIPDYGRYLRSESDALGWMTDDERTELSKYWGPMSYMATNIRRTVDDTWFSKRRGNDDELLDEESTGPIDWPADWREELTDPSPIQRVKAGQSAPQGGLWQSLDEHKRQLRLHTGDILPNLGSTYGTTLWERISD